MGVSLKFLLLLSAARPEVDCSSWGGEGLLCGGGKSNEKAGSVLIPGVATPWLAMEELAGDMEGRGGLAWLPETR